MTGSSDSLAAGSCFIRIRSRVVGGGTETYCLERFSGMPAPRAIAHDSGVITFVVQNGTLRARMRIVQRFRASALRYVVRLRPPPQP